MKDHGKLNATLLTPAYWQKYRLPNAVDFAEKFQAIDAKALGNDARKAALDDLLTAMSQQGLNNPANPVYPLFSAILVQR
ncbi:hypothetical protein ACRYI5_07825 [Furfurilactobacillus sp. WILCCON 0119]|uniref:hypothetical protein n=1 Tax=Furfurilactobacillus entadae TaxID=2922307 RepID=UPI0035F051F7